MEVSCDKCNAAHIVAEKRGKCTMWHRSILVVNTWKNNEGKASQFQHFEQGPKRIIDKRAGFSFEM